MFQITKIFIIKEYRHIFLSIRELTLQVTIIELRKVLNHTFHYDLCKYFTAWVVNISNSLPNSVVESGTVNLFKAYLEKTKHKSLPVPHTHTHIRLTALFPGLPR